MSQILITGGAGYIGSHTAHYLTENGISEQNIIVFDNLTQGHREYLPQGIKFIQGNLLNKNNLNLLFTKIETIFIPKIFTCPYSTNFKKWKKFKTGIFYSA